MSDLPPSPKRNQGLDVLRGLAVLLVVFNHFEPATIPGMVAPSGLLGTIYWKLHGLGWSGVDCFFVLSGFLISGLLFKEMETTGSLKLSRFWIRRGIKILPSYLVLLTVLCLTGATAWLDLTSWQSAVASLVGHGLFLQNYLPANANGPTWSLAVEEHFYLLLPCTLLLLGRRVTAADFGARVQKLCIFVLVAVFSIRVLQWATGGVDSNDYSRTHFRVDSLLLGVLIQHLCRRQHPLIGWIARRPWTSLVAAAPLIATSMVFSRTSAVMFTMGYTALAVGYGMVLVVFSQAWHRGSGSILRPGLAIVGTWSYNIYLWNYFVLKLPIPGYASTQEWLAANFPTPAIAAAQLFVFASVSLGMGALMTYLVERPFLSLQTRLKARASQGNPTPREAADQAVAVTGDVPQVTA